MNILRLIQLINDDGQLTDSLRLTIAKLMIDEFDKPAPLFTLKKYLDDVVEYEKN